MFDENQRRTKISLGDEVEICGNFSSRIPFQITALNGDVGKYAIPCYDRLSKRINLLRGCGEIIGKSIQEIPDNADSRIIMILESPDRCEYANVVPGEETIRPSLRMSKKEGQQVAIYLIRLSRHLLVINLISGA